MPQGAPKSISKASKSKPTKTLHSRQQKSKTSSQKVVKPRDYKKAQAREMARKGAAGLTGSLEKMLAERAGYTEMVKAGEGSKKRGTGISVGKPSSGKKTGKR